MQDARNGAILFLKKEPATVAPATDAPMNNGHTEFMSQVLSVVCVLAVMLCALGVWTVSQSTVPVIVAKSTALVTAIFVLITRVDQAVGLAYDYVSKPTVRGFFKLVKTLKQLWGQVQELCDKCLKCCQDERQKQNP